jgi:hypothetical protein
MREVKPTLKEGQDVDCIVFRVCKWIEACRVYLCMGTSLPRLRIPCLIAARTVPKDAASRARTRAAGWWVRGCGWRFEAGKMQESPALQSMTTRKTPKNREENWIQRVKDDE